MIKRRRKNKIYRNNFLEKQKFMITFIMFVSLLFLGIGYSAFNTNVDIKVKGNVKRIKVSFNPNGGYLDVNSKYVGTTYGDLPTPTREGYTFLGWNGKNMFNPEEFYEIGKNVGVGIDGNDILLRKYPYQENVTQLSLNFKENVQYTLSFDWKVEELDNCEHLLTGLDFWYIDDTSYNAHRWFFGKLGDSGHRIIISDFSKSVLYVSSAGWQYGGLVRMSKIQLEENNSETEYEPFFITSETMVVQKNDHTLTAIWKKNEV